MQPYRADHEGSTASRGTTYFTTTYDIDVIYDRRVQREDSLDADAEANFSNGDALASSAMLAGDHDAFKNLKTFFVAFLNSDVDFDGITGLERRDVFPYLRLLNII